MWNFFLIICFCISKVHCINGIIWNNEQNKFIPIFDISSYKQLQKKALQESYEIEKHNFNKQPIILLFRQHPGIIFVNKNSKQLTGFFGEIWTFLSEYANFTLALKKVPEKRVGIRPTQTSQYNGLLRYIEAGEADVIAKIEIFEYWSDVVDFFLPLWNDRYRLFVQVSYRKNTDWIAHLFTNEVWCVMGFFLTLFSVASIFCSKTVSKIYKEEKRPKSFLEYKDYILYYYGVFCQRSFHLFRFQKSYRILNTTVSLLSMMIISFYSAKILSAVVNKTIFKPFDGLDSLYRKTDYSVIAEKDSVIHLAYEFLQIYEDLEPENELRNIIKSKRITFFPTRKQLYSIGCKSNKNYAIFESELLKETMIKQGCEFVPMGKGYFHTWVASGAQKNFTYKRTIDRGILKLFESGLLNALKYRLLGLYIWKHDKTYEPIDLQKIYNVIIIFGVGMALSIIILFMENVVYYFKK